MRRSPPDVRRVKRARCYTMPELAAVLTVSIGTARRWVREGMPLIDREWPRLVNGGEFISWFKERRNARKVRCGPREMYCCRCRDARPIMPGSAIVIQRNEKSSSVRALCILCAATMNRHCSKENAAQWLDPARPLQGHKPRLLVSPKSLVEDSSSAGRNAKARGYQ